MKIRLRYSLLTLLLLTALVAGGVKLWRGPHRAVMSDPPTAEEQALLRNLEDFRYWPVAYEYEYLNEGGTRKFLGVKAYAIGNRPIPVLTYDREKQHANLYSRFRGDFGGQEGLDFEAALAKREHVVCWLFALRSSQDHAAWLREVEARKEKKELVYDVYFLTSRKQIFFCNKLPDKSHDLQRVELSDILDPAFRECVAAELATIAAPQ